MGRRKSSTRHHATKPAPNGAQHSETTHTSPPRGEEVYGKVAYDAAAAAPPKESPMIGVYAGYHVKPER